MSHIEWREDAPNGKLERIVEDEMMRMMKKDDHIICRTNSPLMEWYFKFLKSETTVSFRKRLQIKGILTGLLSKIQAYYNGIKRRNPTSSKVKNVRNFLIEFRRNEVKKMEDAELDSTEIQEYVDTFECLLIIYEHVDKAERNVTFDDLKKKTAELFSKTEADVYLSTVHGMKGKEADRIFIYKPDLLPLHSQKHQGWQWEQELNLAYVAFTRNKKEMYFVDSADTRPEVNAKWYEIPK